MLEFGKGRLGHHQFLAGSPLGVGIVDANDVAIAGELEIALHTVGPLLPGQLECRKRIFRRGVRRTAVSHDELSVSRHGSDDQRDTGGQVFENPRRQHPSEGLVQCLFSSGRILRIHVMQSM